MDKEQRRSEMSKLELLDALSGDLRHQVVNTLLEISEYERFAKNAILFTEGDQGSDVGYILLKGDILVRKTHAPEVLCQAPELLGEMKQFNPNRQRTATVEAVTELLVMRFSWHDFNDAIEQILSDTDQEAVIQALESCAWQHFTG